MVSSECLVLFPAVRVAASAFEQLAANRSDRQVHRAAVEFEEVYSAGQAREHVYCYLLF